MVCGTRTSTHHEKRDCYRRNVLSENDDTFPNAWENSKCFASQMVFNHFLSTRSPLFHKPLGPLPVCTVVRSLLTGVHSPQTSHYWMCHSFYTNIFLPDSFILFSFFFLFFLFSLYSLSRSGHSCHDMFFSAVITGIHSLLYPVTSTLERITSYYS